MVTNSIQEPGEDTVRVAANIRSHMAIQRASLRSLSEKTSELGRPISYPQLSRYARGDRAIDLDQILVLSKALGVPMASLLAGVE